MLSISLSLSLVLRTGHWPLETNRKNKGNIIYKKQEWDTAKNNGQTERKTELQSITEDGVSEKLFIFNLIINHTFLYMSTYLQRS